MADINNILLVGLGNPYEQYRGTRHNVGADCLNFCFNNKIKILSSNLWVSNWQDKQIFILIEPDSMNISGKNVKNIMEKYNCKTLIVFVDDLDTSFGDVKLKFGVSHGGHNGTRDIINVLQHKNFFQIRIGIGRPITRELVHNYVLGKFSYTEKNQIQQVYAKVIGVLNDNYNIIVS